VSISANSNYKPSENGYAISSYTSISTAELNSGVYFSSGMKKMASSGYAYSERPTGFNETTLWTNSSPTSSFADQNVTLSDDIDNYDYIQFEYANTRTNDVRSKVIMSVSELKQTGNSTGQNSLGLCATASGKFLVRRLNYVTDTQIHFRTCYYINSAGSNDSGAIPITIKGLKSKA
jgi:hypothetical protein